MLTCLCSPALDDGAGVPATVAREAVSGSALVKQAVFASVFCAFSVIFAVKRLLGTPLSQSRYSGSHLIENMHPQTRKLFLYSSSDIITNAKLLREFVAKHGGDSFDFGESKHVQHFKTFPKLYEEKVQEWLGKMKKD